MRKCWLLIAWWCLAAGQVCGDPVNYTITNLTATMDSLSIVSFSGSGESITINGSWGTPARGGLILPGEPVNGLGLLLACGNAPVAICMESGLAGTALVNLAAGSPLPEIVTTGGVVTFQTSILTYVIPAVATGEFSAVCASGANSCVPGTVVGDVFLDVPGNLTYQFGSVGPGEYVLDGESFAPAPEPSSFPLMLVGSVSLLAVDRYRRGRAARLKSRAG